MEITDFIIGLLSLNLAVKREAGGWHKQQGREELSPTAQCELVKKPLSVILCAPIFTVS